MQELLNDDAVETIDIAGHDTVFIKSADARGRERGPHVAASDEQLIDLVHRATGKDERDV